MVLISEPGSGEDIRAAGKLRFHVDLLSSGHQGDSQVGMSQPGALNIKWGLPCCSSHGNKLFRSLIKKPRGL